MSILKKGSGLQKPMTLDKNAVFMYKPPIGEVDSLNGEHDEKQSRVQIIGERLLEIDKKHGYLKAEYVVDDARHKDSPLHRHFEWNDSVAGEKFRLGQARQLISMVYIKPAEDSEVKQPVRAWVNVLKTNGEDRRYEGITVAMSDELKRKQLLNQAVQELKRFQARYAGLQELSRVFEAMDKTIKNVAA